MNASTLSKWIGVTAAAVAIVGGIGTGSIYVRDRISSSAVTEALLPLRIQKLETTQTEHATRIVDLEKKAELSISDRAALHREVADSRAALAASIKDLAESLNRRLDRLDDKTEKISERVGVPR